MDGNRLYKWGLSPIRCVRIKHKISVHARKLGMQMVRTTTYRKAAEEGWAPPPTNDVQKAIWNEAKPEQEQEE